ncbi:MAG TPA: CDP-alcohol phosphatidyltransferase family protein [Chthoniobacterales bacterium]|nr:CDP-alcohol phosphatidyltransferase family protein [Chthoniobacterales bacterium]
MEISPPQLLILARAPEAFCELFGVSLLERLLRVVQRLGFREALILSESIDEVSAHLAPPSWARADVALRFRPQIARAARISEVATGAERTLVVSAGYYYDARLLKTLAGQAATTLLIDSAPPPASVELWSGHGGVFNAAALVDRDWLSRQDHSTGLMDQLSSDAAAGRIASCDAARQPTYIVGLRKHVRPVFFPAPPANLTAAAEKFPRDLAQNGVLDFPGLLDSPIEDWIIARLCRTSITPNQITLFTMLIGLAVTALFAMGHLWFGVALAYAIEVLDGVDGKLARTKVETTAAGDWEHVTDYVIELSWWTALAWHFHGAGLRHAFALLLLLVGSDILDRLAKRAVKQKVGRNLDDVSDFDRFVRCIGGRRNINVWILIAALALGDAANGFVLICCWTAATAAAHTVRALQIRLFKTAPNLTA